MWGGGEVLVALLKRTRVALHSDGGERFWVVVNSASSSVGTFRVSGLLGLFVCTVLCVMPLRG